MKVTFLGAAHEVTGSMTLIECGNHRILVDCGMEQGKDIFVNQELPINPALIDCVLITHAHIDHSGNLPLLCKNGFDGKIYSTAGTASLCNIMLRDSAHIQMFEAEWKNRKAKRAGLDAVIPIYDMNDALSAIEKFIPCNYKETIRILENIEIRFTDVGHLLGSSAIEIWLTEGDETRKIVFSGDVGNINQPLINDPSLIKETDYLVIESTYGNRFHAERPDYIKSLATHIQQTFDKGGNLVIPSFAVGRTQELLFFIRQIKQQGMIKGHDSFPVYVDSPLANEATSIFLQCDKEYFDEETRELLDKGINPIWFEGLEISQTSDDSKAINSDNRPKVIISASGMCEAGRIRHHLKHNLWRYDSTILFVGYQANGTLGRTIHDGAKEVKLFGETIEVNAKIDFLDGISGHADKKGLINFINGFETTPKRIFVNHGDDDSVEDFTECLNSEYGYKAVAPYSGTVYDLITNEAAVVTEGVPIDKHSRKSIASHRTYDKLLLAIDRLRRIALKFEGRANKDIAKFAVDVANLCDKWQNWLDS